MNTHSSNLIKLYVQVINYCNIIARSLVSILNGEGSTSLCRLGFRENKKLLLYILVSQRKFLSVRLTPKPAASYKFEDCYQSFVVNEVVRLESAESIGCMVKDTFFLFLP